MSPITGVVCPKCRSLNSPTDPNCRVCKSALKPSSGSKVLRIFLPLSALGVCGLIAVVAFLQFRLAHSAPYLDGLQAALSSPEVQKSLGANIRPGIPLGQLQGLFGPEFSEWAVPLTGSQGHGHLYGVATEVNGAWDYSRLVFVSGDGKEHINLTPAPTLNLPPVPKRQVFVLPLGYTEDSLDWAPRYYKGRFGIDVSVLPPVPVDAGLIDATRGQLDSEKCAGEFFRLKYLDIVRDPSTILIAVTSADMYIPSLGWSYGENYRQDGRFAVVSSARLHPRYIFDKLNPEYLNSRLQKLLTKNIALLYFDLPMSSDVSSLMSGGVLSGEELDQMGGNLIGAEGNWTPWWNTGAPAVSIYEIPGREPLWQRGWSYSAPANTSSQVFTSSLDVGLLVQRKTDFLFPDDPAMDFTRVYRNMDDRSRAFGVGGSHPFDMFLGGQMGVAVDLIMEDGHRVHFEHASQQPGQTGDTYLASEELHHYFKSAVFAGDTWRVTSLNGWTYLFPYRPKALPQYVTVLTSFLDPEQHEYHMERDPLGVLLKVESPSGNWLHFESDEQHRVRAITSSTGRVVRYDYDKGGNMVRETSTDGQVDVYTYDDKSQMLSAGHESGAPYLTNEYLIDGTLKEQHLADGRGFRYGYFRDSRGTHENQIFYPNGRESYIEYQGDGYVEWLPFVPPYERR